MSNPHEGAALQKQAQAQIDPNGKINTLVKAMQGYKETVSLLAPKTGIGVERILAIAAYLVKSNAKLMECTPESILSSVMLMAMSGLDPRPGANEAFMIPYGKVCQMQYGYAGLINLAYRSGLVDSIQAYCVYDGDLFRHRIGSNEAIDHEAGPNYGDATKVTHAYAVCYMKGTARPVIEVLNRKQIDRLKAKGQSGPAWGDYDEMAKAKVLKRICKKLPKSVEWNSALQWDGAIAPNLEQYDRNGGGVLTLPEYAPSEETGTDAA